MNSELLPAGRQAEAYKRTSLSALGDHKMNQDPRIHAAVQHSWQPLPGVTMKPAVTLRRIDC